VKKRHMDDLTQQRVAPAGDALAIALAAGICDAFAVERAQAVARETGISGPQALIQLGLVSERVLAESFAAALGLGLASPEHYPDAPVLPERLLARVLRSGAA
jgi:general secretion pathway protein E